MENQSLNYLEEAKQNIILAKDRIHITKTNCPCNNKLDFAIKMIDSSKENVHNYLNKKKSLLRESSTLKLSEMNMVNTKGIIVTQFLGKLVQELAVKVDEFTGRLNSGVLSRPSTWVTVLGGIGAIYYGDKMASGNMAEYAVTFGSNLLTKSVDYIQQGITFGFGNKFTRGTPIIVKAPVISKRYDGAILD